MQKSQLAILATRTSECPPRALSGLPARRQPPGFPDVARLLPLEILLLRVRVKTVEAKNEILKMARDLKQCDEYKRVFIAPDLTRKQQLMDKDLRKKLKQRRSDGGDWREFQN